MKLKKRRFNREFKIQVCEEIDQGLKTQAQASREYMIGSNLIGQWMSRYRKDPSNCFPGSGSSTYIGVSTDEVRVKELEAALGRATLENKILRDANALFKKRQLEQRRFTK
jgi:transposase-like protein